MGGAQEVVSIWLLLPLKPCPPHTWTVEKLAFFFPVQSFDVKDYIEAMNQLSWLSKCTDRRQGFLAGRREES